MSDNTKKSSDSLIKLYLLLTIVLIIWIIFSFILPKFVPILSDRGAIGDSFGTINSLFSGLAFAGIIYTILLQRTELSLQRQELIETRKELSRSADAQEKLEFQQKRQAQNLKITAKLNALNSLLNYYSAEEASSLDSGDLSFNKKEKEKCVQQIKKILNLKEN